jgi:hypothetical protein
VGLPCRHFHFPTAAPTVDGIYEGVCEAQGTDVPVIRRHCPSRPPSPGSSRDAASRCFAGDSLSLEGRGRCELRIHVSLDGQNVYISGGPKDLFRSSCVALEKLGGTVVKPTTRSRRPIASREWLSALFMFPVILVAVLIIGLPLLIVGLVSIPIAMGFQLRERRRENKLRSRLAFDGRYMHWCELEAKLKSGEGTLIIEHLWTKSAIREWWTEDDLVARSPIPLPTSPILLPEGDQLISLHQYAESSAATYTDTNAGVAKLTEVPDPQLKGSRRKLSEKYPNAKIVVLFLFDWDAGQSVLYGGNAETVDGDRLSRS